MTAPDPDLREHLVAALRTAAFLCDDCCTLEDEAACDAAHPIQAAVLHFDQVADITGPVDAIADAVLGIVQPELDQLQFLRAAVDLIRRADLFGEEILLCLDGQRISVAVNVSDVFAWGGADAEDITPEQLPVLEQAWLDCKSVDADEWTVELYAAWVRGMRPQGAAYPKEAAIAALFDACGPERPIGLGNPRKPPPLTPPHACDNCEGIDPDTCLSRPKEH